MDVCVKIFETHAHYDDESFDKDREYLLTEMLGDSGMIDVIVNIGASLKGCKDSLALAAKYDKVYAAIGVHPSDVGALTASDMEWLCENAVKNPKVVAVGEIGLDYHYQSPSKDIQNKWFIEQIALAKKVKKPIIVHSRDACQDTIDIMKQENASAVGGIVHCYSYTKETAKDFLNMGFYFGIGGVITFKNAKKLIEAVEYIPMDKLLLETDSPYLAPEPYRGKRNDSTNISFIAEKIAQIKGISTTQVIDKTNENARKIFQLIR